MWWDTWIVDGAGEVRSSWCGCSYPVCIVQIGHVQSYALFIVGARALAFFGYTGGTWSNNMEEHPYSIILFAPIPGLLFLCSSPAPQKPLIRLSAKLVHRRVPALAVSLPWRASTEAPRLPVRRARRLDPGARRQISHRHRRHQPAAGHAHHADGLPRHPLLLERDRGRSRNITPCSCCCRRACSASSCRSISSCSTSSGNWCWSRCTSSSASGAARGSSTRRSSSSSTRWPARC